MNTAQMRLAIVDQSGNKTTKVNPATRLGPVTIGSTTLTNERSRSGSRAQPTAQYKEAATLCDGVRGMTSGRYSMTQHKQVLDYKRANFELMKEELGSYNYEVLMNNKNAEECYMILKDKIATATDHHIPRKRIRPTNNPPWFSQEIKRLINARQHSYRRLKRYQTEPHRQEHIHACRAVGRTKKSTKRNKEITVAAQAKTNPKSFYKYVND
ncbi:hypothetical protein FHG87_015051, partial [Trinorchestia longiramus]